MDRKKFKIISLNGNVDKLKKIINELKRFIKELKIIRIKKIGNKIAVQN